MIDFNFKDALLFGLFAIGLILITYLSISFIFWDINFITSLPILRISIVFFILGFIIGGKIRE